MECIKKTGLLLCIMMLTALQSCVRESLEDCPPTAQYALRFNYSLHAYLENGKPNDDNFTKGKFNRFVQDVHKMCVYVFDNNEILSNGNYNPQYGVCIYVDTLTLTGPFSRNYEYPLPLTNGNYEIIVWGWGFETGNKSLYRSMCVPDAIKKDVTNITDARFILTELRNSVDSISGKLEKTFYGEVPANLTLYVNKVDTVNLMNISKTIRVIFPDVNTSRTKFPDWENNMQVYIEGDNGAYFFEPTDGGPTIDDSEGYVKYKPFQTFYTDSILDVDPIYTVGSGKKKPQLIVDISTLRLMTTDKEMKLIVKWENSNGPDSVKLSLLDLLMKNPNYAWNYPNVQRDLDIDDKWEIVFPFFYETTVTAATNVVQWHVVKSDVAVGGIMQ